MAYGLRVQTTTGKTQIDSTQEMFGMVVKSSGAATTVSGFIPETDLLLVSSPTLANGGEIFLGASWNTERTTATFREIITPWTIGTPYPLYAAKYIHLTRASDSGFSYPNKYGIQTLTPSGAIAFDSRALVATVRPVTLNYFPAIYFAPWDNQLMQLPYEYGPVALLTDYVSFNGSRVGNPGSVATRGSFPEGFRFVNNVLDTRDGIRKTGIYYENYSTLGDFSNQPNYSSIITFRDQQ